MRKLIKKSKVQSLSLWSTWLLATATSFLTCSCRSMGKSFALNHRNGPFGFQLNLSQIRRETDVSLLTIYGLLCDCIPGLPNHKKSAGLRQQREMWLSLDCVSVQGTLSAVQNSGCAPNQQHSTWELDLLLQVLVQSDFSQLRPDSVLQLLAWLFLDYWLKK